MNHDRPDPPVVHVDGGSPDLEVLAAYDLDVASGDVPDARIAAHVDGCAACTARLSDLRAVVGQVRGLVPPMPADLPERLGTLLAGLSEPASVSGPDPVDPPVAAVGAAGPGVVTSLAGRHRSTSQGEPPSVRRGRLVRAIAGIAAGIIVLGGGSWLVSELGHDGYDSATSADSGAAEAAGGNDGAGSAAGFDRQTLVAAVPSLLTDGVRAVPQPGGAAQTGAGPDTDGNGVSTSTVTTPPCLARVPVATTEALLIVSADYDGVPALILLFAAGPDTVQVTVVSDCSDGGVPGVLDQFTAPR